MSLDRNFYPRTNPTTRYMHRILRYYSKGTKRINLSFDERNTLLSKLPRDQQYPLLCSRAPVARIKSIVDRFSHLEHSETPQTEECEVRGRINSIRMAGKYLVFIDLVEGNQRLQIVLNSKKLAPGHDYDRNLVDLLRKGDAISAVGKPWRTKAGELSLLSSQTVKLLSPTLRPLPDSSTGRTILKHNRVAELKAFSQARDVLRAREAVIRFLSNFLNSHDFMQVQTPHLSKQKGGASANTFETRTSEGSPLHLRVAPELWLKRLIIGGFDRVYEVGNSYRNEAVDATHNPEFTTCEFYMSFADLPQLIDLTQQLMRYIAENVAKEFPQFSENCNILLQNNWQELDFVKEIEQATGKPLSLELGDLRQQCTEAHIELNPEDDIPKCLDRLASKYIEPKCTAPTFITNHPSIMAPLAKQSLNGDIMISRRFELFINGMEYVNAYEEENDPVMQLEKLKLQNPLVPDKNFVDCLEWGLPPTGGWGMGVDRLVMLLTNSPRICDVLPFGDMNHLNRL